MSDDRNPEIDNDACEEVRQSATEPWERDGELHSNPEMDAAIGKLLENRWDAYLANPDAVITFEEMRKKYGRPLEA